MNSEAPAATPVTAGNNARLPVTDQKRAAIVRAAVAGFQERGYDRTSMDQIAARARVSKRTVYNHFPSKDDLFQEIVEELTARAGRAASFSFDAAASLEQQLTNMGSAILDAISGDDFIQLARVVLSRFLHAPELAASIHRGHRPFHNAFKSWAERASAEGDLEIDDPELAARQFAGLLNASAFWPQVLAAQPPLTGRARERVLRATTSMFLDHYRK